MTLLHYLVFPTTLQLSDFDSASSLTYISNTLFALSFSIKKIRVYNMLSYII